MGVGQQVHQGVNAVSLVVAYGTCGTVLYLFDKMNMPEGEEHHMFIYTATSVIMILMTTTLMGSF